jgi:pyruvate/2-oxoglutarate dehydrogenase complex dihydrolipoamide dehydrogenase (E3) component
VEPDGGVLDGVLDLLVIGGGTAGLVGAKTAARLGARTLLVEYGRTGGDCLWTGCVPSKTILSAAARSVAERAASGRSTPFSEVRERIAKAISTIEPDDSPESVRAEGAVVLVGTARFTAPGEAEIDGRKVRFRQALIATGSAPSVPDIPGLQEATTVTSETIWDLEELPERLAIIGGGPISCELGQAFARLGAAVTIIARSGILPKEDREAAALVRTSLETDGVTVLERSRVDRVRNDGETTVHLADGQRITADVVLAAIGRKARTSGLGLAAAGVECDSKGQVVVDPSMRSSNPTIWAAGDVTPHPEFTHLAGVYASVAASNAVLGLRRKASPTVPRVTYTSPELAAVGLTGPAFAEHTTSTVHHSDVDRAVTEEQTGGMTRLVIGKRGKILGGTIVGPRAGESLAELTLAVHQGLGTRDLAGVTHPYPTYNDGVWNAAIAHARSSLDSRMAGAAVKSLLQFNRWRRRQTGRR